MLRNVMLIGALCCWLGMTPRAIFAQGPGVSVRICSAADLDVSALPGAPSFGYGGHLFVLEMQNVGGSACLLQSPQFALEPTLNTNNQPRYAPWKVGDSEVEPEHDPVLAPEGWAHVMLAWTSRAGPELGCDEYSGLRVWLLDPMGRRNDVRIEVRHLWIRACGEIGITGTRPGRYSATEGAPKDWSAWFGEGGLAGVSFAPPTLSTEIAEGSPVLSLSAKAKRTMLGDRLFSLRLDFPRLTAEGCAFSEMRKRESDGNTVISIEECDANEPGTGGKPPAVPWYHQAGVMGLEMGNLDFTPKHVGPLVYEIVAPVGRSAGANGSAQYASTRVNMVARDPALPRQAVVLDPVPACSVGQLQIVSASPVISTGVQTLRAYNATNVSGQACSLAGVPRARGLDEKGDYEAFFTPVCPNCENEFFMPRPNGRIDLKPGETAHLLAGATGTDKGYCGATPKLEFSLDRDASLTEPLNIRPLPVQITQSVYVPFEANDCVSMDVSAWRKGAYDGDPLNLRAVKVVQADEAGPIPTECNKPELLVHGRPHPIEGTHNPEYAVSMEQHQFLRDEPVPLYLWTNNSSDKAIQIGGCSVSAFSRAGGFVLYDAYGHRLLSKRQIAADKRCKENPSRDPEIFMCTASILYSFPAHTCTNNSRIDLTNDYDVPPGEYTISTRDPGDTGGCANRERKPFVPNPAADIGFTVLQP